MLIAVLCFGGGHESCSRAALTHSDRFVRNVVSRCGSETAATSCIMGSITTIVAACGSEIDMSFTIVSFARAAC